MDRLTVFENRVLRKLFGHQDKEETVFILQLL
jgi:hypothetical protein